MPRSDWFRRKSWSQQDQKDFFARLAKSRSPGSKAQYLRIQAIELTEARDQKLTRAALELIEKHLIEFNDPYERTQAHSVAARCHEQLGQLEEAIAEYRLSLQANLNAPNLDPGTSLAFPWFIVSHSRTELFREALEILERAHLAFPVQKFQAAAIRAQIAEFNADHEKAAKFAVEALKAAGVSNSDFRFHRRLGLVGPEHAQLVEKLRRLAEA
jgi:tetratricopeptide (TPR) repeat protein